MIAFAGKAKKIAYLRNLGIELVHNYKLEDVSEVLAKEAPNGVNCYFDNVSFMCCTVLIRQRALVLWVNFFEGLFYYVSHITL